MNLRFPFVLLLCACCALSASAADWSQWRGPNRDGVAPESPPLIESLPAAGLTPVWLSDEEIPAHRSGGWSSPVVAGGKVYLFTHKKHRAEAGKLPPQKFPYLPPEKRTGMTDEQYADYERNRRDEQEARAKSFRFEEALYCLDADNGKLLWANERGSAYTRFSQSGTPAVVEGKIYFLGAGRTARCVDAENGNDVWQTTLPGEFRDEFLQSSFVVVDGVAAVSCNWLLGLDAQSGKILWQVDEGVSRTVHASPTVWRSGERSFVIANMGGGETVCVDAKTGAEQWREKSLAGHSTPVIVNDLLITYGGSRKAGLRCFRISPEGAEHQWTFQRAADAGASPVVVGDYVYVQGDKRLACVDLKTGKSMWSTTLALNRPRYTSLVAADGKVVYAFDGVLCFAAAADQFRPLMGAKINREGLLAEETAFRRLLNMNQLETTAEGQRQAERLWRDQIGTAGPLPCSTPAIVDGRIYIRLKNGLACYDWRVQSSAAGGE